MPILNDSIHLELGMPTKETFPLRTGIHATVKTALPKWSIQNDQEAISWQASLIQLKNYLSWKHAVS